WEQVTEDRRQVKTNLQTLRPVVDDLSRARALAALVETGDAAEHQHRLQELRGQLEVARSRLQAAEANHNAAIAALAKGTAAQREVAKRERRLGANARTKCRLLARQEELAARLEGLEIPAGAELLNAAQKRVLDKASESSRDR